MRELWRWRQDLHDAMWTERDWRLRVISVAATFVTGVSLLAFAMMVVGAVCGDGQAANRLDCASFTSRAVAQSVYDADRSDPHHLDGDGDGQACEWLP